MRIGTGIVGWGPLCIAVVMSVGCSPEGTPVGPVAVAVSLGGGSLDPSAFSALPPGEAGQIAFRQDFCQMPTEDLVTQAVPSLGPVGLSDLVELTSIELMGITLTATTGDFAFVREMVVRYVPKPMNGQEAEPVELGRASSATGFGSALFLEPTHPVDLLELIRESDANPASGCPQLEILVTGVAPEQPVAWQGEAEADVYGVVDF